MARQASTMLDLVRSCRLVFTATITSMLSTMMRGQVREFTAILAMNIARKSEEIFSGFIGRNERPQVINVLLTLVVKFIFLRLTECAIIALVRIFRSFTFFTAPLK